MIVGESILLAAGQNSGSAASYADIAVPTTGWTQDTANNCYKKTVTVSGMTAASRARVFFCPPHDMSTLEEQEEAYSLVYAGESTAGGLILYASDEPETAFEITVIY